MSTGLPEFRLLTGSPSAAGPVADFVGAPRPARGGRPWVMLNVVASVDGATALNGESRDLSGPADREVFHALRGIADAILVGAGTARADRYGPMIPRPGVREARRARGQEPVAPIVLVSRTLGFDWSAPLFAAAEVPTIVAAPEDAPAPQRAAAAAAGRLITAGSGGVALARVLEELAGAGIGGVLCEGGPRVFAQLAAGDLIDELFVTVSPALVAGDSRRILHGPVLASARPLTLAGVLRADDFLFLRYEVRR